MSRSSAQRLDDARRVDQRLVDHVERLGAEHPPISLDSVDFHVDDPAVLEARFGHVLDYMARVELEVDRNVLELMTMLPDPPEIDVRFYRDVWQPQETQHGRILDELQVRLGRPPADADLDSLGTKLKVLGALGHLDAVQDVSRMLYYLTGMATERSAVLAYNLLHDGVAELGERGVAETIIAPIRRQEPGHYAFYQLSARGLWSQLAPWQRWLVRHLRRLSFAPVGANNDAQKADFGDLMATLGIGEDSDFSAQIARVEMELLWARGQGMTVPDYVARAFREARELAVVRASGSAA
ncbi:hypothetical protein I601_1340 [Nocardioides dokdonensis FR1436]|uniref:GTP-binding protein LepA n=1 Tax=Nocardioides dokdonensis FR1436 TaxID=1300347 RepID=A0A1A9GHH8_9ACTN|nr:GTP-binding protein LepA [Nocardioides dokdonensis]ANH37779.1 hypothetical protein I601_1340 [Nocardioides dokdonensis FR1436]